MGTPEGLRGLLDLVSGDEARAQGRVADIDEVNALLERYAVTVTTLTHDVARAEMAAVGAAKSRLAMAAQVDRVAGMRVQELVDMAGRAEAAETDLAALVAAVRAERAALEPMREADAVCDDAREDALRRGVADLYGDPMVVAASQHWCTTTGAADAARDAIDAILARHPS